MLFLFCLRIIVLIGSKDAELWVEDGDCYVHLYAQGASRRGPSFCVPFRAVRQKKCTSLLKVCRAQLATRDGTKTQDLLSLSGPLSFQSPEQVVINLFIPAPDDASRQDAFKWHITTRNFFAFLLGKPLVGYHMGQAFIDLQDRMQLFRSGLVDNHQDFLQYAEDQGYRDFAECTDYALASLQYAETFKLRNAWIDAFAHCVGMNESLSLSPEYAVCSSRSSYKPSMTDNLRQHQGLQRLSLHAPSLRWIFTLVRSPLH